MPGAATADGLQQLNRQFVARLIRVGDRLHPPAETTGPESPQPSQNGGPAISVASLPIGGNHGDAGDVQQCADVNWLGTNPIPRDVSISIDAIDLDPAGVFTFGGDACDSDSPPCTTSWVWAAGTAAQCVVAVTQVVDPAQDVDVQLVMKGTVHCTEHRWCEAAVSGSEGSQIAFTAQPGVVSSSSGSSGSSDSSDSGSTESSSGSGESGSTESSSSSSESSAGS